MRLQISQRPKPGLKCQHLTCVQAVLEIGRGSADDAELNSRELVFHPGQVRGGDYHIRISTARSTTLVLQTVLLALLSADEESRVVIEGGTHNPMAPPVDFLQECYLPVLHEMGAKVILHLDRYGFAPAGGSQITAQIKPSTLKSRELLERGKLKSVWARILSPHLESRVASREATALKKHLGSDTHITITNITDSAGPAMPCS